MKTTLQPHASLWQRLAKLNAEKVRRHGRYAWTAFRCRVDRMCGHAYPGWIDAIPTHMTGLEKQILHGFARALPRGSFMAEIGSYYGASSCCLASGVREGKVYCIDTWMNDAVSDGRADVFAVWQGHTAPLANVIAPVRGFSQDVADRIPDQLSLLFVDGDHSYEAVKRDLLLYLPKLRAQGILVLHDWSQGAVRRAVVERVHLQETERLVVLPNLYSCRVGQRP
jgi:predicted O-methyltransferase YrrM